MSGYGLAVEVRLSGCGMLSSVVEWQGSFGGALYVRVLYGLFSLVGEWQLGRVQVGIVALSRGLERSGSRGLSCRGHVRCSKEWIGSHVELG